MTNVNFDILKQNIKLKNKIIYYKKYLPIISKELNRIHNTQHNLKYWEIIVGPWLMFFISTIEFIYLNQEKDNVKETDILLVPYGYRDFALLTQQNYDYISSLKTFVNNKKQAVKYLISKEVKKEFIIKKILSKIYSFISMRLVSFSKIITVDSYFSFFSILKLLIYSKFKIIPLKFLNYSKLKGFKINLNIRDNIIIKNNEPLDQVDKILAEILPYQIPFAYIEDYRSLVNLIPKKILIKKQIIFNSVGWQENELFKLYCAESFSRRKVTLVGYQHGGFPYGMGDSPIAQIEKNLVDKYLTWGWSQELNDVKFFSIKISKINNFLQKAVFKNSKKILFISTCGSYFFPEGYSVPSGKDWNKYCSDQQFFFKYLNKNVEKEVKIRMHPDDHRFNNIQKRNFESINNALKYDKNPHLIETLLQTKLVIIDHLHTTFLETLGNNIPTVIFIDESIWQVNSNFYNTYQKLKKANIIHSSPKSAADFINNNFSSIEEWWGSDNVVEALNDLQKNYIRLSNQPEKDLAKYLVQFD